MDSPPMTQMGMKRKDLRPDETAPASPMSEADYENELVHPTCTLTGKQADKFGADQFDDGDLVKQTVVWRVKKTVVEKDGTKDTTLDLKMVSASDPEKADDSDEPDADDNGGPPDADSDDISPGLGYILAGKGEG